MTVKVVNWVFEHSETTLGSRLVLLALADNAHDDGRHAWPSTETLAKKARLSRRQVQRDLRALEAGGHIELTGESRHGTNIWRVVLDIGEIAALAATHRGDDMTPPADAVDDAGGASSTAPNVSQTSPEPSGTISEPSPPLPPPKGGDDLAPRMITSGRQRDSENWRADIEAWWKEHVPDVYFGDVVLAVSYLSRSDDTVLTPVTVRDYVARIQRQRAGPEEHVA